MDNMLLIKNGEHDDNDGADDHDDVMTMTLRNEYSP